MHTVHPPHKGLSQFFFVFVALRLMRDGHWSVMSGVMLLARSHVSVLPQKRVGSQQFQPVNANKEEEMVVNVCICHCEL